MFVVDAVRREDNAVAVYLKFSICIVVLPFEMNFNVPVVILPVCVFFSNFLFLESTSDSHEKHAQYVCCSLKDKETLSKWEVGMSTTFS